MSGQATTATKHGWPADLPQKRGNRPRRILWDRLSASVKKPYLAPMAAPGRAFFGKKRAETAKEHAWIFDDHGFPGLRSSFTQTWANTKSQLDDCNLSIDSATRGWILGPDRNQQVPALSSLTGVGRLAAGVSVTLFASMIRDQAGKQDCA